MLSVALSIGSNTQPRLLAQLAKQQLATPFTHASFNMMNLRDEDGKMRADFGSRSKSRTLNHVAEFTPRCIKDGLPKLAQASNTVFPLCSAHVPFCNTMELLFLHGGFTRRCTPSIECLDSITTPTRTSSPLHVQLNPIPTPLSSPA